jgi:predicted nucleic-acid-binding protein
VAIGLDTSVVVRLITGEPEALAQAAAQRLEMALARDEPVIVTDLVAVETYHALRHHYQVPESEVRELLGSFLRSGVVRLDPETGIDEMEATGGAGFVDRLIHARHRALGAVTLTFDGTQARLEAAELLKPL